MYFIYSQPLPYLFRALSSPSSCLISSPNPLHSPQPQLQAAVGAAGTAPCAELGGVGEHAVRRLAWSSKARGPEARTRHSSVGAAQPPWWPPARATQPPWLASAGARDAASVVASAGARDTGGLHRRAQTRLPAQAASWAWCEGLPGCKRERFLHFGPSCYPFAFVV